MKVKREKVSLTAGEINSLLNTLRLAIVETRPSPNSSLFAVQEYVAHIAASMASYVEPDPEPEEKQPEA